MNLIVCDNDAREIGQLYQKSRGSLIDSVRYAAECGRRLTAKKASLTHGQWLPWLEANAAALGFETRRTASRLMDLGSNGTLTSHLDEANAVAINRQLWGNTPDEDDGGDRRRPGNSESDDENDNDFNEGEEEDSDNSEPHVRGTFGTGENEWYTPAEHIDLARRVLGEIDLDPASNEHAQKTVRAAAFYTKEDDGLTKLWHGAVWLNPPYAQPHIADFADKMVAEWDAERVKSAIVLTHNYTDTAWFQKLAAKASAICFTRGRVRFVSPSGELAAPTQGQAFFYFGDDIQRFAEIFGECGFVAEGIR